MYPYAHGSIYAAAQAVAAIEDAQISSGEAAQAARVQADTGMDYIPALRHVRQRQWLREAEARRQREHAAQCVRNWFGGGK